MGLSDFLGNSWHCGISASFKTEEPSSKVARVDRHTNAADPCSTTPSIRRLLIVKHRNYYNVGMLDSVDGGTGERRECILGIFIRLFQDRMYKIGSIDEKITSSELDV